MLSRDALRHFTDIYNQAQLPNPGNLRGLDLIYCLRLATRPNIADMAALYVNMCCL